MVNKAAAVDALQPLTRDNESTADTNHSSGFSVGPFNLDLYTGHSYAVVGDIASGKSTFLLGLLQELNTIPEEGEVFWQIPEEEEALGWRIASGYKLVYCAQAPHMHSGSVRENILMGLPLDPTRYSEITSGCCLDTDFKVCDVTC